MLLAFCVLIMELPTAIHRRSIRSESEAEDDVGSTDSNNLRLFARGGLGILIVD